MRRMISELEDRLDPNGAMFLAWHTGKVVLVGYAYALVMSLALRAVIGAYQP